MRVMYIDPFAGVSGDMLLGALLDAGLSEAALREVLTRVPVSGYDLMVRREKRLGLAATRAEVRLAGGAGPWGGSENGGAANHGHRNGAAGGPAGRRAEESHGHADRGARRLPEIEKIIEASRLPGRAGEWATAVFRRLAEAEAKVHGTTPEEVHFHEVGAVDAIVDIAGVCSGLALLEVEKVAAGPLPMGSGYVDTSHGRLPVPAPAVVELVRGLPTAAGEEPGELTTPTGAAIVVALSERFGPMPRMAIEAVGYGAGARQGARVPNVVRVIIGRPAEETCRPADEADSVWLLEANVDDASGETLGAAAQALWGAGAIDVWLTPVIMKKGRPGVVISALADDGARQAVEECLFRETTTFGVRRVRVDRSKLGRRHVEVATPFGVVRVKEGRRGGRLVTAQPEYEDCHRLAQERGVTLREVYEAALAAHRARA